MSDSSPLDLLERAAELVGSVYTLPRPTESPPDHQTLPQQDSADTDL